MKGYGYKARFWPLALMTILIIAGILLGGVFYLISMVTYINDNENANYFKIAGKMSIIIEQDLKANFAALQTYAEFFAAHDDITVEKVTSLLSEVKIGSKFDNLAIINEDGYGVNDMGVVTKYDENEEFLSTRKGETYVSDEVTTGDDSFSFQYVAPIIANNEYKGALVATCSPYINSRSLEEGISNQQDITYIFDSQNKLVAYSQGADANATYDGLLKNGYLYEPQNSTDLTPLEYITGGKSQLATKFQSYIRLIENRDSFVWYENPLQINQWHILVGRPDGFNSNTMVVLKMTVAFWFFTMFLLVFLFALVFVLQFFSNKRITKLAYTDTVTGGYNWFHFQEHATEKLRKRKNEMFAIITFDVDNFKVINDMYGHAKGDDLLKGIYDITMKWINPKTELGARYMGDQFNVLVEYKGEDLLRDRINNLVDQLNNLQGIKHMTFSFGVFVIQDRKLAVDRMRDFASIAQDVVKDRRKNAIAFFDDRERKRILHDKEIENTMEEALKDKQFKVYLQPKYSVVTRAVAGAEALVRWISPTRGFIYPNEFIPTFEKNGFIIELDKYMLDEVCKKQKEWLDLGYNPVPISVNVSRAHLNDPNLVKEVSEIVDNNQVPHELIEFELTESAFFDNKQALLNAVNSLRELNFLVSMDDFGSGYSSLNSLKDLPLDIVKLDGEFFGETNNNERGQTVIRDTIAMAKNLHMKIVAEGIETKAQVDYLQQIGCDVIQGYYFAKPMIVSDYEKLQHYE